jgi:hypothetical protein
MKSKFASSVPCLITAALVPVTSSCIGLASLPQAFAQDQPLDRPNIDLVPEPSVADKLLNQGPVSDFIGDGAKLAVKHFMIVNQRSGPLQHVDNGFVVTTRQSDELLIGGGFFGNPGIQVSQSIPSGDSWSVTYQYPENVQGDAQAYAVYISSR